MPNPYDAKSSSCPSGLTRREFLIRTSALGAASALPVSLLSESAFAATPKKGGRVRIAARTSSESLDPRIGGAEGGNLVNQMSHNNLVEIDADGQVTPELAETWEVSPDAKKWVFKLRKGIEFHNGKALDSKDVVASIKYHSKGSGGARVIVDQIKKISADGKHTVIFKLKEGNADFAFLLSDLRLVIAPAGTKGKAWQKAIGTGAYVLREWNGVRAFATRNPNYWKEGRGHFDEVEMFVISDQKASSNALRAGQVDVVQGVDLKTVDLLKQTPGIQVVEVSGSSHVTFPMRTDKPPFDNNDVRLALKHAIDREALIKSIKHGHAVLGNDHPIAPSDRYHADDLPQRQYDPDKAKYYLKQAGLSNLSVKMSAANIISADAVEMAVLYADQAAKAGITIEVVHEKDKGYWDKIWKKKGWCMSHWVGRPTPDWMFTQGYALGGSWNETKWKHKRFNNLLHEARGELNEGKRREMYVEMQRIVSDEGGAVIPFFEPFVMAATTKLQFGKVAANLYWDGLRMPERWWFA